MTSLVNVPLILFQWLNLSLLQQTMVFYNRPCTFPFTTICLPIFHTRLTPPNIFQEEPDRYTQSGIVAWGIGCGENNIPGVYVDVARLRAWIDDKVAGKGFDPKVYEY